ncbi:hypothetical protein ThrDRAFT_03300 [Frankia casuarinae]|nr:MULTISPECIES: hypothetical protein [Frankia]ETA00937.1 hypothetical protein CcI6DRAFT_03624 [Frankia sp. CcI6]EYT91045.1 hypothetical protein ThrDRAFT_03300 [Frankia casuarinae]KDA41927.1 hypothetical protein BMG523Draft_03227 [Frankia sp. BMG5.23]KFB05896.1 hypothetical protein ALLO2DRAFT_01180 [Frankia sp. Allo2]OAA28839.1 hypothetical protein AAY23_10183 [Frankia casuarinae]
MKQNPAIHRQPSGDIDIAVADVMAPAETSVVASEVHAGSAAGESSPTAAALRSAEPGS